MYKQLVKVSTLNDRQEDVCSGLFPNKEEVLITSEGNKYSIEGIDFLFTLKITPKEGFKHIKTYEFSIYNDDVTIMKTIDSDNLNDWRIHRYLFLAYLSSRMSKRVKASKDPLVKAEVEEEKLRLKELKKNPPKVEKKAKKVK